MSVRKSWSPQKSGSQMIESKFRCTSYNIICISFIAFYNSLKKLIHLLKIIFSIIIFSDVPRNFHDRFSSDRTLTSEQTEKFLKGQIFLANQDASV